jgi:hypothetical protein
MYALYLVRSKSQKTEFVGQFRFSTKEYRRTAGAPTPRFPSHP